MTSQNESRSINRPSRAESRWRSPKTIYGILGLALIAAIALASYPTLRTERYRWIVLRNQIEQAAAPDEPVLVDSWLLYRFLKSKGSTDLQRQLVYMRPSTKIPAPQELVVVTAEESSLLPTLRQQHFDIKRNETQNTWVAAGNGISLPGLGFIRIYFAMPSVSSRPETAQP